MGSVSIYLGIATEQYITLWESLRSTNVPEILLVRVEGACVMYPISALTQAYAK